MTNNTKSNTPLTDARFNDRLFQEGFINDKTLLDEHNLNLLLNGIRYLRDNKVSVDGSKGLSTNDFTNVLKNKLDGIEGGAQVNVTPDTTYNPNSLNAQSGKAVKEAIDTIDIGDKVVVDQVYNSESENAQSGVAVSQAVDIKPGQKTTEGGEVFNDYEDNIATGEFSHSEGSKTEAISAFSHAQGQNTKAKGQASNAGGELSEANHRCSDAVGYYLKTGADFQTVRGEYNKISEDALFIVGNGTSENNRKNAFEVKVDGSAEVQTMGTTDNSVATKAYVDSHSSNTGVTVDQTYNSNSSNAQSGKAVAEAIASIGGGNPIEVDQTYNPNSTNAQSGAAVAQAISEVDTSVYNLESKVNTIESKYATKESVITFAIDTIYARTDALKEKTFIIGGVDASEWPDARIVYLSNINDINDDKVKAQVWCDISIDEFKYLTSGKEVVLTNLTFEENVNEGGIYTEKYSDGLMEILHNVKDKANIEYVDNLIGVGTDVTQASDSNLFFVVIDEE